MHMQQLEDDLINYFGAINELRFGLAAEVPEKPQALIYQEQFEEYRVLPKAGGLGDQPYILMAEMKKCADIKRLFERSFQEQQKDANSR